MPDYEQLIVEYFDIADKIDSLTDRRDRIIAQLRTLGAGKHDFGTGVVTVGKPTRRFSAEQATKVLPPELLQACTEEVITARRAKQVLAPALYDMCGIETGQARVAVKAN